MRPESSGTIEVMDVDELLRSQDWKSISARLTVFAHRRFRPGERGLEVACLERATPVLEERARRGVEIGAGVLERQRQQVALPHLHMAQALMRDVCPREGEHFPGIQSHGAGDVRVVGQGCLANGISADKGLSRGSSRAAVRCQVGIRKQYGYFFGFLLQDFCSNQAQHRW